MSTQVDGTGKITEAGEATEFGNGTDPVTKAAPVQGQASAEEVSGDRPAHWPQDKDDKGEFLVKSEPEMASWYAEQMAKAQKGETTEAAKTEDPSKVAETKAADPAKVETPKAEVKVDPLTDDQIAANLKQAGGIYADEKYLPFAIEVERTGALSEASIAAAAAAFAVPPEYVKTFVDGQLATKELASTKAAQEVTTAAAAKQNTIAEAVLSVMPDPAGYEPMMKWGASADSTLSKDVVAAYDRAIDAGDATTIKALLPSIKAAFEASGGGATERRDITQGRAAQAQQAKAPATKPFGSMDEQVAAQGDRRYGRDPAYRNEVNARIAVSNYG